MVDTDHPGPPGPSDPSVNNSPTSSTYSCDSSTSLCGWRVAVLVLGLLLLVLLLTEVMRRWVVWYVCGGGGGLEVVCRWVGCVWHTGWLVGCICLLVLYIWPSLLNHVVGGGYTSQPHSCCHTSMCCLLLLPATCLLLPPTLPATATSLLLSATATCYCLLLPQVNTPSYATYPGCVTCSVPSLLAGVASGGGGRTSVAANTAAVAAGAVGPLSTWWGARWGRDGASSVL